MALGPGSSKLCETLEYFGSAQEFFRASESSIKSSGIFTASAAEKIKSVAFDLAKRAYEKCQKDGQSILCYGDENYPAMLRNIYCPPAVLYIKGSLPDMDEEVGITVVGSRKCSSYGYEAAQLLSYRLAKAGAVIISGGALGIDSAAHRGCLDAGGKTLGVLACGIDFRYNMANENLRSEICQNGALISEYPPGTGVQKHHFHARNRLLAALARGTVVVEAGEHSGALITANHAAEQGKDIFALPGNLKSPFSVGSNRLIKDGAYPVECPLDVLEQYAPFFPHKLRLAGADEPLFAGTGYAPKPPKKVENSRTTALLVSEPLKKEEKTKKPAQKSKLPEGLSPEAQMIVCNTSKSPFNTDDVIESTGLAVGKILRALTELELFGVVEAMPGGRYVINDDYT